MGMLGRMFGRNRHERAGYALYTAAVHAARNPFYYTSLGVPDTLDGRFDMVGAYVFLVIHRLQAAAPGAPLAQAVFDAMFSDMDQTLREMGVSDMTVGRRVKAMWEAFHGRAKAYAEPLDTADVEALSSALARNVWRGATPDANARALAAILLRQWSSLAAQPIDLLQKGKASFPSIEPVLA